MSDFSDDEGFEAAVNASIPAKVTTNWGCLQVHVDQSQNPILNLLTEIAYQVNSDISVDFAPASDVGIIFLSLKYHNYRPKYVEEKIAKVPRNKFRVLVLLLSVDSGSADLAARHLSVLCTKLSVTFLVGFSQHECAQYIVNFKRLEHKSVDWLRPKMDEENRLAKALSAARGVNSTDADTLINEFGTLANLATKNKKQISQCVGIGQQKAERLVELFNTPFKR